MKIELKEVLVKDVFNGYKNDENGVVAYGGNLNVRPKYQREFVYKDRQRDSVIYTVRKGFPLNVMYWVKNMDGTFEVLDGQQRTISICEYMNGEFAINFQYFHNLEAEEKAAVENYKLMVYFCEGTGREKLDWFKTINIAGEKLTDQELRNAIYTGPWLSDAKRYFSKPNCAAHGLASKYLKGTPIRQDYLETAIDWASHGNIEQYMADYQNKNTADELWRYFGGVISWVESTFREYRKEMKGVDFGTLFDYKENNKLDLDPAAIEKETSRLMRDEDVTNKPGIYSYVITRNEKHLNIRSFTDRQKREAYERQRGICVKCGEAFEINEMEADHINPWHDGGQTSSENCQMLCREDNRRKSGK